MIRKLTQIILLYLFVVAPLFTKMCTCTFNKERYCIQEECSCEQHHTYETNGGEDFWE